VYFVPATLNYALVLEAETLIEDHLKGAGQSRYIIEDDESSRARRVYSFMTS
jgi:glycerol-3-phosphate O-acyltransferase